MWFFHDTVTMPYWQLLVYCAVSVLTHAVMGHLMDRSAARRTQKGESR